MADNVMVLCIKRNGKLAQRCRGEDRPVMSLVSGAPGTAAPIPFRACCCSTLRFARMRPRCAKYLGIWQSWTWRQTATEVREMAMGLASLGFRRGDNLAIIGDNRPRLYWPSMPRSARWRAGTAVSGRRRCQEMVFVLLENADDPVRHRRGPGAGRQTAGGARDAAPTQHIIYDDPGPLRNYTAPFIHGMDELRVDASSMPPNLARLRRQEVHREGRRCFGHALYLGHHQRSPKAFARPRAHSSRQRGAVSVDRLSADDGILSYLPMAWVGDHLFSYAQALVAGFTVNCPESADTVMTDFA